PRFCAERVRLPRYGEGKARPKGSARRPRRRLSEGVERGVFATSDSESHWRRFVAKQAWGSSNAQNGTKPRITRSSPGRPAKNALVKIRTGRWSGMIRSPPGRHEKIAW